MAQAGSLMSAPPDLELPGREPRAASLTMSVLFALALHACVLLGLSFEPEHVPVAVPESVVEVALVAPFASGAEPAAAPAAPAPAPVAKPARPRPAVRARQETVAAPTPNAEAAAPSAAIAALPHEEAVGGASVPAPREAIVARPRYWSNPEPPYPAMARRRGQQGVVLLAVRVGRSGRPESVAVRNSSGFASLDAAAIAAVEHWEFEPGRLDGEPVPSQVEVPIRFELRRD
jgi:protein TonB